MCVTLLVEEMSVVLKDTLVMHHPPTHSLALRLDSSAMTGSVYTYTHTPTTLPHPLIPLPTHTQQRRVTPWTDMVGRGRVERERVQRCAKEYPLLTKVCKCHGSV